MDSNIPVVTLDEVSDDFVQLSVSALPKVGDHPAKVKIDYSMELDGKWVQGKDLYERVKQQNVMTRLVEGRSITSWRTSPLKPITKYKFNASVIYGNQKYLKAAESFEVTTKALAPKVDYKGDPLVLSFDKKDVTSYHVEIKKRDEMDNECDLVFETLLSPYSGQDLQLPSLTRGEKYLIRIWYIDLYDRESGSKIIWYNPY